MTTNAVPIASLNVPPDPFLGEQLNFTVAFDNTSASQTGYGPYVDLVLPATGKDGAGGATDDGIKFSSATYLGAPVVSTAITFDSAGHATHPYAKDASGNAVVINGTAGDQLIVLELPFGSFTPSQPAAVINVVANISNLADADQALNIKANGGFRYGNDALDNSTSDPTLLGGTTTAVTTPRLLTLRKEYVGPEDETATGPNFVRQYRIIVDIADGQTLTNLDLTDLLPDNLQFVQIVSTTVRGASVATTSIATPSTTIPGGTLTRRFASVTGTVADDDAEVIFSYYVPLNDSGDTPVINAVSGDDATATDDAKTRGNWAPLDSRDTTGTVTSDSTTNDHTLIPKSIAIQKSVSNITDEINSAGDVLQYTLEFQVSDYFAFENISITDIFSDGQDFVPGSILLTVNDGHASTLTNVAMDPANFSLSPNFSGGQDQLILRVSDELIDRAFSPNGRLIGGAIPVGGTGGPVPQSAPTLPFGGTVGTITFKTKIRDNFEIDYPSGDASVDQGDLLTNAVNIHGDLLRVSDLTTLTGQSEDDTSSAAVQIARGLISKTIYAVNGNTVLPSPLQITPGDTVTYRLTATLPSSDIENFSLTDFLPLPLFNATEVTAFDDVKSAAAPAAGHAKFGPSDTFRGFFGIVPTRTTDSVGNSVKFDYGDSDDPLNRVSTVDILFTVTASSAPFADGLYLTNQLREGEGSTNSGANTNDVIVQIKLTEPVLNITKGVVSTTDSSGSFSPATVGPKTFNAPGTSGVAFSGTISSSTLASNPINSNVTNLQAGDLVRFAIAIENTGNSRRGAFDVAIKDTLPAGFSIPSGALNLQVTDGTGAAIAFTKPDGSAAVGSDLFGGGLQLVDPGATAALSDGTNGGAIDVYNSSSGRNIVVITYDLKLDQTVQPKQSITNTATLFNYAGLEGGPDFTSTDMTDTANAKVRNVVGTKTIVQTSEADTPDTAAGTTADPRPVTIGEIVRYRMIVEVPESNTTAFSIVDTLPAGLTYVSGKSTVAFVSNGSGMTSTTVAGAGLNVNGSSGSVSPAFGIVATVSGNVVTFSLGDLLNQDGDTDKEYVVVEFNALVNNTTAGSNDAGDLVDNTFSVKSGSTSLVTSSTARVRIVEPSITNVNKVASSPTILADQDTTYTITFSNSSPSDPAGTTFSKAYDARLLDSMPAGLSLNTGSVTITTTGGVTGVVNNSTTSALDVSFDVLPVGSTVTVVYTARVTTLLAAGTPITNTAHVTYTSLPGALGTDPNPTGSKVTGASGTDFGERNGSLSSAVNDYDDSDYETVTAAAPNISKTVTATSQSGTGTSQYNGANYDLTIGETVTYTISIAVTEGRSPTKIIDNLPTSNGILSVLSSRVVSIGSNISGSLLSVGDFGTSSDSNLSDGFKDRVVFDFGTLTNTPDYTTTAADLIVVEIVATLENVAANQDGDVLVNSAYVDYGLSTSPPATASIDVVAPDLSIDKSSTKSSADADELVTYTTVLKHSAISTANAYNLQIVDPLESRLVLVPGSITTSKGTVITGNTAGDTTLRVDVAAFLLTDADITITYQVRVQRTANPSDILPNTATVFYDTLPGGGGRISNRSDLYSVTVNASTLSGRIWFDANNDGIYDGSSSGITGVSIQLIGVDHLGNNVNLTTTTTTGGVYTFSNLRPGTYSIYEAQPASYFDGKDKLGSLSGVLGASSNTGTKGADQFTGIIIGLDSQLTGTKYDFGELVPASLSGVVFDDRDNNGLVGAEAGIGNVTITLTGLDDLGNSVSQTATTGVGGNYYFGNLRPSNASGYTLIESQPATYLDGQDVIGTPGGTAGNDTYTNIVLSAGVNGSNNNFGELMPASLSGWVYHDLNNDGAYDGASSGIVGVTVRLTGTDDRNASVNLTATTLADGSYVFSNLRPSNATGYTITETQTSGYLDGKDTLGTPGGTRANDVFSAVILNAGVNGTSNNFGELLPASISGRVYVDLNNNAVFDAPTETGISNATVLLTGTDDLAQGISVSLNTLADGTYSFSNLRPGTYTVTETQPSAYIDGKDAIGNSAGVLANDSISSIALDSAENDVNLNFGELPPASLSGFVYHDQNNDGLYDGAGFGIASVVVTLTGYDDRGGAVFQSMTSAADGRYHFDNLRPSDGSGYTVTETQPTAYLDGRTTLGSLAGSQSANVLSAIVLPIGVNCINNNFGELLPSSISGNVYLDLDNNGVFGASPETGIGSVTVRLTGTNDLGANVTTTITTSADGSYHFLNLRPGRYAVSEAQPFGLLDGKDSAGNSAGSLTNDLVDSILLVSGTNDTQLNFGELTPASLAGYVYHDSDNNGMFNGLESGIVNVTITLSGNDDLGHAVNLTTVTDSAGFYRFSNLRPSGASGGYTLTETQPVAYLDGRDTIGLPGGSAADDSFSSIVLNAGVNGVNNNFGELLPASIAGRVFADLDNDGVIDSPLETGIANVVVTLTGTDDLRHPVTLTLSTQPDGTYRFSNLRPGIYVVTESQPSAYLDGQDSIGNSGGTLTNDVVSNVVLASGQDDTNLNFGELPPGSLSGYVYHDLGNDGVFDGFATGISGAIVNLTGINDLGNAVTLSATTNGTGYYSFPNLRPSNAAGYRLTEVQPAAYLDGKETLGTPGGTASNDQFAAILIVAGADGLNNNFGELVPATISGRVYSDLNNDGEFELATENGISNAVVTLTGVNDLNQSINTSLTVNVDGTYSFLNLRPGTYTVTESQPAGYLDGKDSGGNSAGVVTNDVVSTIVLVSGLNATNINFGELVPGSLAGYVYHDINNDGLFDGNVNGIMNTTVTLTGKDDLGNTVSLSQSTNASGAYLFSNLRPSNGQGYTLTEAQPAGFLDGKDAVGSPGGAAGNDLFRSILLTAGTDGVQNNFGEVLPNSIAGRVYRDLDNDGAFDDAPETGIGAVTVTLTGTNDLGNSINTTVLTGADGTYQFVDLRPGLYVVTETQPGGLLDGKDSIGNSSGTLTNDNISNIVLVSDIHRTCVNFGELAPSSLSGNVYHDLNNDGQYDGPAYGIGAVAITLSGQDDVGNDVFIVTTNAADGAYHFVNLRPSSAAGYTITESQPVGYLDGQDTVGTPGGVTLNDQFTSIVLVAGIDGIYNYFGELAPASISGHVYRDLDNDGLFDGSPETGIGAASVTLTGTDDLGASVNTTVLTNADGAYQFLNLRPGTYVVTENQPAGLLDGKDFVGNSAGTVANDRVSGIILQSGAIVHNVDFGELPPASLSGNVYHDANNDGVFDGPAAGLEGVTVALIGTDDLGATVNLATTTLADGAYHFTNLRPSGLAGYTLTEAQPDGYLDGKDTIGTPGGTGANDVFTSIVLNAAVDGLNNNFGEVLPNSISGRVYRDLDNDGLFDNEPETGIGGVTVVLNGTDDFGNTVNLTATTGSDGTYSFCTLRPGIYSVSESQPAGFLDGKDNAGDSLGTLTNDRTSNIVLVSGMHRVNVNYGELPPSSLAGFVYHDANDDGQFDGIAFGISGVTVTLTGKDDLGADVSLSTTTGSNGAYQFTNLRPASAVGYLLREIQPAVYLDGLDTIGTPGGTTDNDQFSAILLAAATNGTCNNFGELIPASLSGRVYSDLNNNGLIDGASETGIGSVIVTLTGIDDLGHPVHIPVATNSDGTYAFLNLRPGIYQVAESQAPGFLDGQDLGGNSGGVVTDDLIDTIVLVSGTVDTDVNFGELVPSSLSGFVYHDLNNDGVFDGPANGLGNVTVTLTGRDDLGNYVSLTTTTNPMGAYRFSNLRPSNSCGCGYTITETQPSVYFDGKDTLGTQGGEVNDDFMSSIVLAAATEGTQNNFGEVLPNSVAGRVFRDLDNDGTFDGSTEAGIGGVTVTLTGTDDLGQLVNVAVSTNSDGTYSVLNLRPGTYVVTETQPAEFLDGKDSSGDSAGTLENDRVSNIILISNHHRTEVNFGELPPASLSGSVYHDANNDGIFDGPANGIARVTVRLSGQDDLGEPVDLTTTTLSDGSYQFMNLRPSGPSGYRITESQPAGYLDGRDTIGTPGGAILDDVFTGLVLNAGVNGADNNFGELIPARISGLVYRDFNHNGTPDGGVETGVADVAVTLTGTDDRGQSVQAQVTTSPDGTYSFPLLRPGTYEVVESQPAELLDGLDQPGNSGGVLSNDRVAHVVLKSGSVDTDLDFGELPPSSLAGLVFRDLNNDGAYNDADSGMSGVTITLSGQDYLGNPVLLTTATQSDGTYHFENLLPGSYLLTETQPAGVGDGSDKVGSQGGAVGQDQFTIVLGAGVQGVCNNYAELPYGDLSITKVNTDAMSLALENGPIHYVIVVKNSGPGYAQNAAIFDDVPNELISSATWTATGTAGTVFSATGSGDLQDSVTIPAGGEITYHLTVVLNSTFLGYLTNTATVTPPANGTFVDTNPNNNSAQAITEVRALNIRVDVLDPDQPVLIVTGMDIPCTLMTVIVGTRRGHSIVNGMSVDIADPTTIAVGVSSSGSNIIIPLTLLKNFKSNELLVQVIANTKPVSQASQVLTIKKDQVFPNSSTSGGSGSSGGGSSTGGSTTGGTSGGTGGQQPTPAPKPGKVHTPKVRTPKVRTPKPPKVKKQK